MGESTHNLGILYADVCNSVRLYENLGDEEAHRLIHDCLDKLVEITRQYNGTGIRTPGDGVMSGFHTADATFDAARPLPDPSRQGHLPLTPGSTPPSLFFLFQKHHNPPSLSLFPHPITSLS